MFKLFDLRINIKVPNSYKGMYLRYISHESMSFTFLVYLITSVIVVALAQRVGGLVLAFQVGVSSIGSQPLSTGATKIWSHKLGKSIYIIGFKPVGEMELLTWGIEICKYLVHYSFCL